MEAKRLGEKLEGDKWADKIMGYAGRLPGVEWIVLTNGDEYHIYNAAVRVSSFEQRLFRKVCLTKPNDPTEETLALLSKERIRRRHHAQWQIHFANSQVLVAVEKLFSPTPDPWIVGSIRKQLKGLVVLKEIKASLGRLRASFEFPVPSYQALWQN